MNEVVYAIWNFAWGEHWFLYELGEADDGFYFRCVDADSWETLALGLGDSPTEASTRAFSDLLTLAGSPLVDDEPQACFIVHALLGDEDEQCLRSGT